MLYCLQYSTYYTGQLKQTKEMANPSCRIVSISIIVRLGAMFEMLKNYFQN